MRIGILGGGQLGRMLWEASQIQPLHGQIECTIYHDQAECPAFFAGAPICVGEFNDVEKLTDFFTQVDSFTLENEFLNCDIIEKAWSQSRLKKIHKTKDFLPDLSGIRTAQDKLKQKQLYKNLSLPSSDFKVFSAEDYLKPQFFDMLVEDIKSWKGLVLKKSRMGYDGKGNFFIPQIENTNLVDLEKFCKSAADIDSFIYAEQQIKFTCELALVSCRDRSGNIVHYPLVETIQKNGTCHWAYRAKLKDKSIEVLAAQYAAKIGHELNLTGTFAVEFFLTEDGQLYINEMAPRVHNSGHFSLSTNNLSQFSAHLKCFLPEVSIQKIDVDTQQNFVMLNLLGPDNYIGPALPLKHDRTYWYDKKESSPRRKLGHLTLTADHLQNQNQLKQELLLLEKQWHELFQLQKSKMRTV